MILPVDPDVTSIDLAVNGWCNVAIIRCDGPPTVLGITARPTTAQPRMEKTDGKLSVRFPGTINPDTTPLQGTVSVGADGYSHRATFAPSTVELCVPPDMPVDFTIV